MKVRYQVGGPFGAHVEYSVLHGPPTIAQILKARPANTWCFYLVEPSPDPGKIPDALPLPRHMVLEGTRHDIKAVRLIPRSAKRPAASPNQVNPWEQSYSLPHHANQTCNPATGRTRLGPHKEDLMFLGERIVRVSPNWEYVVEELDGTVVEIGTFVPATEPAAA